MRDIGCEVTIEGSNYQNTFKDPKRIWGTQFSFLCKCISH